MSQVACKECSKKHPHYGSRYDFSCIGCYARWICDCYNTPEARLSAIQSNGRHAVDDLNAAVNREFERRKR